ncbi:MAG: hypothetical protein HY868_13420 [Chloroflexi bacterium]|nr:hypothetical protein [Chloroflexota bacterium]
MKLDVAIAGAIGLLMGAGIYYLASSASAQIPTLVAHPIGIVVIGLILVAFAGAEIPIMVFGLKKIAASTTPRPFLLGTHAIYVTFASVYAAIFVLLTGQIGWGMILAAGLVVRFGTGALFK